MSGTFEVNGRTYRVKTVQPWVQPYLTGYGNLARKQPETAEEAERISEEIRKILDKLLSLIDPYPLEEDVWPVFLALMSHIQGRGASASKFFRQRAAEGRWVSGEGDPSEAERASGDESR